MAGRGEELGINFTSDGADKVQKDIEGIADAIEEISDDNKIKIDADTDAAKSKVEDLVDEVQTLEDAEVEIGAETESAEKKVEKFIDQVDDLTKEAREVRFEFRQAQLEREIRNILRTLERLEDPVEIEVEQRNLEATIAELRELERVANERYEVDIQVDTRGNARRAVDEVRTSTEGFNESVQRGIGPLRGFTDELGGAAGAGGVMGNAIIDAGEAIEIFGQKAGISSAALGKISGALAGIGLAVGAGVAVWQNYRKQQELAEERIRDTAEVIDGLTGTMENFNERVEESASVWDRLVGRLFDPSREDDAADNIDRISDALLQLRNYVDEFPDEGGLVSEFTDRFGIFAEDGVGLLVESLRNANELTDEQIRLVQGAVTEYEKWGDIVRAIAVEDAELGAQFGNLSTESARIARNWDFIRDEIDKLEIPAAFRKEIANILVLGDEIERSRFAETLSNLGFGDLDLSSASDSQIVQIMEEYIRLTNEASEAWRAAGYKSAAASRIARQEWERASGQFSEITEEAEEAGDSFLDVANKILPIREALEDLNETGLKAFAEGVAEQLGIVEENLNRLEGLRNTNTALEDLKTLLEEGVEIDEDTFLPVDRLPKLGEYVDDQNQAAGEILDIMQRLASGINDELARAAEEGPDAFRGAAAKWRETLESELGEELSAQQIQKLFDDLGITSQDIEATIRVNVEKSELAKATELIDALGTLDDYADEALFISLALDAGKITPEQAQALALNQIGAAGVPLPIEPDLSLLEDVPDDVKDLIDTRPYTVQIEGDTTQVDDDLSAIERGVYRAFIDFLSGDTSNVQSTLDRLAQGVTVPIRYSAQGPLLGNFPTYNGQRAAGPPAPTVNNIFNAPSSPSQVNTSQRSYTYLNGTRGYYPS